MHFLIKLRYYHSTQNYLKNILICKKRQLEQVCLIEKDLVDPCKPSPKVIIVGAGLAGLSAASRLIKAGIRDVTVLEATDRPGGRIHSIWLTDTIAEVGAEWIFGSSLANTTTTLAAQEGLLDPSRIHTYTDGSAPGAIYMTSAGRPINKSLALKAFLTFKQIENRAYGLYELGCGREHGTLLNFFALAIEQELQNFPNHQRESAAKIMYAQTNEVSSMWGTDLGSVSADLLGSFTRMSGQTIGIPSGFVGVLAPLIRDIPQANIHYKKVVNNIQWSKVCDEEAKVAARVAVKCCDGSLYCGDYVVVTVSLGVLKSEASKLFTPSLPAEKLHAIKSLGYGNISKVFLEYQRPFWIWREGMINLVWSMDELKKKDNWVTGIGCMKELPSSQQILVATVGGKHATQVEKTSEEKIAEDITALLRKFTGDPSIPYPNSILRTKWKASPYFKGTNSYMAMNSTIGHQCDLAAPVPVTKAVPNSNRPPPIPPIIFFAGEATSLNYFSTVHGARMSGLRAAQEIIDLTKLYAGPPPLPGELPKEFDPC